MGAPYCFVCVEQLDDPYQMQIVIPQKDTRGRYVFMMTAISFQRLTSVNDPLRLVSLSKKNSY